MKITYKHALVPAAAAVLTAAALVRVRNVADPCKLMLFGRTGFTVSLRRTAASRPDVELIDLSRLSYPFDGDLPDCVQPTPSASPSASASASPQPSASIDPNGSPTPTPSDTPTQTPTPTPTPTGSPTPVPTDTPTETSTPTPTDSGTPGPSGGGATTPSGALPSTGARLSMLAGVAVSLFIGGAGLVLATRRRD